MDPDFVLCMGDDTTDEDMFKALEGEAYTIKVNSGASSAQYTILSQQRVLPLLNSLIQPPVQTGSTEPSAAERTGTSAHPPSRGVSLKSQQAKNGGSQIQHGCRRQLFVPGLYRHESRCQMDVSFPGSTAVSSSARLLDEDNGGHFCIRPTDEGYSVPSILYPNTNVLCTEFTCRDGKFVVKTVRPGSGSTSGSFAR
jgi:hypothetical protein